MDTPLRLGNRVDWGCEALWRLPDRTEIRTPLTPEQYAALALPGAAGPPRPRGLPVEAVFAGAGLARWDLDTPSRGPEDGVVAEGFLYYSATTRDDVGVLKNLKLERTAGTDGEYSGDGAAITLTRALEPGVRVESGVLVRESPTP